MKFLQTGDLHLGKFFYEYQLLEDQQHVLNQLFSELKKEADSGEPYDALVIAGDVYDRSLPPAEAVQVFSEFLAKIQSTFAELHVLIIPGNHDSALRLSYAQEILEKQRIHIRTDCSRIAEPVIINGTAFYLMPFLQPACLAAEDAESKAETQNKAETARKTENAEDNELFFDFEQTSDLKKNEAKTLMSQSELAEEAIKRIKNSHIMRKEMPAVLVAHLFAIGSIESDSERIIWGTAEQVDSALFDGFSYVALGHLHRFQQAAENAYYSGSPLAYSFSESGTQKNFLKVKIHGKDSKAEITPVPVIPLHRVVSLAGSFEDFFNSAKYDEYADSFLEIESMQDSLIENPVALLREKFPYLLSFRQDRAFEKNTSKEVSARRTGLADGKTSMNSQFELFIEELYDANKNAAEIELFNELFAQMKEANHEAE